MKEYKIDSIGYYRVTNQGFTTRPADVLMGKLTVLTPEIVEKRKKNREMIKNNRYHIAWDFKKNPPSKRSPGEGFHRGEYVKKQREGRNSHERGGWQRKSSKYG